MAENNDAEARAMAKKMLSCGGQLRLSGLSADGNWKNYKVEIEGKTFKLSKCDSEEKSAFVQAAAEAFKSCNLKVPEIICREKEWLLQEFVFGDFFDPKHKNPIVLEELAIELGKAHSLPASQFVEITEETKKSILEETTKKIWERLGFLKSKKALGEETAIALESVFSGKTPKEYSIVLAHSDFTKGNIVVKDGALHKVIDYCDTCIGIKELDIARTIFNLDLDKKEETRFLEKYRGFSDTRLFEKNREFWMAAISVKRLANRLQRDPARLEETRERLEKAAGETKDAAKKTGGPK